MNAVVQSRPPFEETQRKVSAYLRLCGLAPAVAEKVGASLLEAAAARTAVPAPPAGEVLQDIDAWTATLVYPQPRESPTHRAVRGFAQMFLAGTTVRWPDTFLAPQQPPEMTEALTATTLEATPPLAQMIMKPQDLDLGPVSKMADETWRTFDTWPFLRGLVIWFLFLLLLAAAFYLVRF